MTSRDDLGMECSGADALSLGAYRTALHQFQCYIGDPVASIDAALEHSPGFVMGHALRAYLHLLGTQPDALPAAREAYQAAVQHSASARERGHLQAIRALLEGRWHDAGRALEDVSIEYPRDALALQAGHLIDFFTGRSRMLRDRIARALGAWSAEMPGYHAVLGMHAFGLEETADYRRAERQGRRAVELQPRDGWAWHAVAHVMEMEGRPQEGIAWLRADPQAWSHESSFAVHCWWHLALYHLELGEIEEVLALFDGPIDGGHSSLVLDMVDASALLWRLGLCGVDVGARWNDLAARWAAFAAAGNYAFNDAHAMMAFSGAGRVDAARSLLEAQHTAMQGPGDNAAFTREVGQPVTLALRAFGDGEFARTVELLRAVRSIAHRFGGSHAQRDVIDWTLLEAALRSGQQALAAALCAERVEARPSSPLARRLAQRAERSAQAVREAPGWARQITSPGAAGARS